MSHQPGDIRLRPLGVANPRDIKLYPWAVSGNLEITEVESGAGVDLVHVDKLLIIVDAGEGIETLAKLVIVAKDVTDTGSGAESLDVAVCYLPGDKQPETELDIITGSLRDVKRIQGKLRVYSAVIDEARLSIAGDISRLVDAYVYPAGVVENLRGFDTEEHHIVAPRLTTDQVVPKGWTQGHKWYTARIYTLGRNTILDALLDEGGDSPLFDCINIRGLDRNGVLASIFVEDGRVVAADPALRDGEDVVIHYTIRCAMLGLRPNIGVLRMVVKPVSAPMTVFITHPIVSGVESSIRVTENSVVSASVHQPSAQRFVVESAVIEGSLRLETEYEATIV